MDGKADKQCHPWAGGSGHNKAGRASQEQKARKLHASIASAVVSASTFLP